MTTKTYRITLFAVPLVYEWVTAEKATVGPRGQLSFSNNGAKVAHYPEGRWIGFCQDKAIAAAPLAGTAPAKGK